MGALTQRVLSNVEGLLVDLQQRVTSIGVLSRTVFMITFMLCKQIDVKALPGVL